MSDDVGAPSAVAGWNARIIFGAVTLGFSMGVVAYLVLKGSPTNSLHESALAWAFAMIGAVLLGFGIGSVAPLLTSFTTKK